MELNMDLELPLCCLFPLGAVELSLLLSPTHRDKPPCKTHNIQLDIIIQTYYMNFYIS